MRNRDIFVSWAASPLAGDEQVTHEEATAQWVENRDDAGIDAWFAAEYPHLADPSYNGDDSGTVEENYDEMDGSLSTRHTNEADPTAAASDNSSALSDGRQLQAHLNGIGARDLSFAQAADLGVELVHHPDSAEHQVFHTAGGDVVFLSEGTNQWDVVVGGRNGVAVKSGSMERVHQAYTSPLAKIADTAQIDPSATVEPGARVGPHATVGQHAHVGAEATVASYARIEAGAFVGAFSSIKDGSRVGPGAVVGAGSRVGPTTNIGAGARVEQRSEIAAFDNIAANSRAGSSPTSKRAANGMRPGQITQLVDRLATIDREG